MAILEITFKMPSVDKPENEPDEDLPAYQPDPNGNEDYSGTHDQNQGSVEDKPPSSDAVCDRCNGNHESEDCPYYSYTTNEPAKAKARQEQMAREDVIRRRVQAVYYLCGFLILMSGAISMGVMIALARMLLKILNNETWTNSACLQDGQISAEQPEDGELVFILYIWLGVVIIFSLLFILRIILYFENHCFGECCLHGILKAMYGFGAIFVLAYFASFVVYIRIYDFLNEFVGDNVCQEFGADDVEYERVGRLSSAPLPCYIIFMVSFIIFGILTCLRMAGKIRIESTDL